MIEKTNGTSWDKVTIEMNKLKETPWTVYVAILAALAMIVVTLFTVIITYPHHSHFGRLAGVIIEGSKLTGLMDLLFPFIIDLPILITGLVLLASGSAGLSEKFQRNIRIANIACMALSSLINYISVFSGIDTQNIITILFVDINTRYIWAVAGIIAPIGLWVLSEMFFNLIKEFVMKDDTTKTVDQLNIEKTELTTMVMEFRQELNSNGTEIEKNKKINDFAEKQKLEHQAKLSNLEVEIAKKEEHAKNLNAEVNTLKKEKSNIQSWFSNMATSKSTNKDKKINTTKRRAALLKEFAKQNGHNLTSLNQDVTFFESNVNMNDTF